MKPLLGKLCFRENVKVFKRTQNMSYLHYWPGHSRDRPLVVTSAESTVGMTSWCLGGLIITCGNTMPWYTISHTTLQIDTQSLTPHSTLIHNLSHHTPHWYTISHTTLHIDTQSLTPHSTLIHNISHHTPHWYKIFHITLHNNAQSLTSRSELMHNLSNSTIIHNLSDHAPHWYTISHINSILKRNL